MITPMSLFEALKAHGIGMITGVPDSLLESFCAYVDDHSKPHEHITAANEGNAIALAAGYHLATGRIATVYMQNSGIGNAINPLVSLTDPEVYRIPLLMIIGWRGEPGRKDEPQHVKQGRVTPAQLELLEIPYWILDAHSDVTEILANAFTSLDTPGGPVALLVRRDTFSVYRSQRKPIAEFVMNREQALRQLLELARPDDLVISTTGKTSRELFELRVNRCESQRDFLTVGSMGHTASIALGVALGNPR